LSEDSSTQILQYNDAETHTLTAGLWREDNLTSDMAAANESEAGLSSESMASSAVLKTAKKELRTLMKQKLSNVTSESVNAQSRFLHCRLRFFVLN
jgi:hypothetical protein